VILFSNEYNLSVNDLYTERWPPLTFETEVIGDSRSTNEMGPSWVGSLGLSYRTRNFCHAFAALVGPVLNNFFLTEHYFNSVVP
jgi:hypothetical protein